MTKTVVINGVEHQVTVHPSAYEEKVSREDFRSHFSAHLGQVERFKAAQREQPVTWRGKQSAAFGGAPKHMPKAHTVMQVDTGHGKCYCTECVKAREAKAKRRKGLGRGSW